MKSRFLITITLIVICFVAPFYAHARGIAPDAVFVAANPDPVSAPFDGGLSLLIAAGVGYASKKAYDKRKKENLTPDIEK